MKVGTYIHMNMVNSMVIFDCIVLNWKYPFWVNLVQKGKIVGLRWYLVPKLIHICGIRW